MRHKIFITLLTLLCITLLCSCADDSNLTETTGETTTQSTDLAFGDTNLSSNASTQLIETDFIITAADTDLDFPVFTNKYPVGHGGAEYDITDEIKELVESNAKTYLNLLNMEYDADQWRFDDATAQMTLLMSDGDDIRVNPHYISYWCSDSKLEISNEKQILAVISQEPHIKAMCDFIKITDPEIKIEKVANENGVIETTIIIYQKTSDRVERVINSEFNSVNIHMNNTDKFLWASCSFECTASTDKQFNIVSYSDAVSSKQIDTEDTYKGCEIKYYDNIIPGYYVPCYVFYNEITDSETNEVRYQATIEPMYKITE